MVVKSVAPVTEEKKASVEAGDPNTVTFTPQGRSFLLLLSSTLVVKSVANLFFYLECVYNARFKLDLIRINGIVTVIMLLQQVLKAVDYKHV